MRAAEQVDRNAALPILTEIAEKDAEMRLRSLAKELATRDPAKSK